VSGLKGVVHSLLLQVNVHIILE